MKSSCRILVARVYGCGAAEQICSYLHPYYIFTDFPDITLLLPHTTPTVYDPPDKNQSNSLTAKAIPLSLYKSQTMITNLWKTGLSTLESIPIISSMQTAPAKPTPSPPPADLDKIVDQLMRNLSSALGERLGEKVQAGELREVGSEAGQRAALEGTLIETKEKYNDLVNRSTNLYQQARKISNSVGELVTSINLYLESEEMLVPLKEIQKGINELLPEKVDKQVAYLIRIFENNFAEVVARRVRQAEAALQDELKLLKNLNRNLEGEIVAARAHKNNDESKYFEQTMKIAALTDRLSKLTAEKQELEKECKGESSAVGELEREVGRLRARENELLERVRAAEARSGRLERTGKEQQAEVEALGQVVERLKARQEEMVEELEAEHKKREAAQEALRKKLHNEKTLLQETNQSLRDRNAALEAALAAKEQEVADCQQQLQQAKQRGCEREEGEVEGEGGEKVSVGELRARAERAEAERAAAGARLEAEMAVNVNKEVVATLFLNYDDESKEWGVRRNIKHQLYALLGLNDRIPKEQPSNGGKWFGLF